MKVWRRVLDYAKSGVTSIIHDKRGHEETRATASRALGPDQSGHYVIVLTLEEVDYVSNYMKNGGDKDEFLNKFEQATSPGFNPDLHLEKVGVANQTTMLKSETEEIQRRIRETLIARDGHDENYRVFDTICGATQERQDALFDMLKSSMDTLIVVGGYNSSNTAHLVEIGQESLPTFFIKDASCLDSLETIAHFDLHTEQETRSEYPPSLIDSPTVVVGITAGASCPANLIEATILRVFEMRGIPREGVINF